MIFACPDADPAGHAADRMARAALSLSKSKSSQVVLPTYAVPRSPRWLASSAGQRLASSVALHEWFRFVWRCTMPWHEHTLWEASGWLGHYVDQPRFVALASGALARKQAQIASRSEVCRQWQEMSPSSRTRLCGPPSPAPTARHSARLAGRPSHAPESLQVPKAVLAALQGNFAVDLTTDAAVTRMRSCVCLECTV